MKRRLITPITLLAMFSLLSAWSPAATATTLSNAHKISGGYSLSSPTQPTASSPAHLSSTVQSRITTASASSSTAVPATSQWVNTGIFLSPGDQFSISATGSWSPGPPETEMVGPDGSAKQWPDNFLNLTDIGSCEFCATTRTYFWAALIGYIGFAPPAPGSYTSPDVLPEAQKIFVVGSNYNGNASESGILWLNFNDDAFSNSTSDNAGEATTANETYFASISCAQGASTEGIGFKTPAPFETPPIEVPGRYSYQTTYEFSAKAQICPEVLPSLTIDFSKDPSVTLTSSGGETKISRKGEIEIGPNKDQGRAFPYWFFSFDPSKRTITFLEYWHYSARANDFELGDDQTIGHKYTPKDDPVAKAYAYVKDIGSSPVSNKRTGSSRAAPLCRSPKVASQ